MAARTFSGTGLFSAAARWDTPPVAGDTITIASGADCTYDDNSGSAWGAWTVNGIVRACTTAGTYTLKMGGTIAISTTGQWLVGSAGTPYPTDCLFVVDHNASYGITLTGNAVYAEYAAAITRDYTTLTGAESAGATRLEVDHDLTGDNWNLAVMAGTAEIGTANVNKAKDYELRVISAITSTYIDITAGLTASKIAGTIIAAVTRNVRHTGYTGTTGCVSGGTGAVIRAEYKAGSIAAYLIGTGTGYQINAALHGASRAISAGSGHTISDGSITGNTNGISASYVTLTGTPTINNTNDLRTLAEARAHGESFGATFAGTTQHLDYSSTTFPDTVGWAKFVAWDIGGVAEALKAWMYAGNVSSTASKPGGWAAAVSYAQYWLGTYEKSTVPLHIDQRIQCRANVPVTVTMHCLKAQNSMTQTPRVQIIDPTAGVFTAPSILAETVMADDTNFQTLTVTYTPTRDRELVVRVRGQNATGTLYWRTSISDQRSSPIGSSFIKGASA